MFERFVKVKYISFGEDGKGEVHVVQERDREEQMALALQMMSNLIEDKDVRGVLPNEYVEGIEILCSRTADQLTRDDYFYIYDDDECVKMIAELETNCALIEAYQVATRDVFHVTFIKGRQFFVFTAFSLFRFKKSTWRIYF